MKTGINILFLFTLSLQGYCQSKCDCFDRLYHLSVYYGGKNNELSTAALKDAISFLDADVAGTYYYLVGQYHAYDKQFDSAAVYYTRAILEGGYDVDVLKDQYPKVYKRLDLKKIESVRSKSNIKINYRVYDKFVQTLAIDQYIRSGPISDNKLYESSKEIKTFVDSIYYKADSGTYNFIKFVLERFKFPNYHSLGFQCDGFVGLILHVTAYKNGWANYIFRKLEELNKQCNYAPKSQILFLRDRQKYMHEGKSSAGLFGEKAHLTTDDLRKVDSIRLEYNYLRLADDLSETDSLPKGYKPIPYPPNYFCLKKYHLD